MSQPLTLPVPSVAPYWRTLRRPALIPPALRPWLSDSGSLTRHLQRASQGRFRVELLNQHWGFPRADECRGLQLRTRQRALIREVRLYGGNQAWVEARTIIPQSTLCGANRRLLRLGNRPLGSLLFQTPGMRRQPLQIARLRLPTGQHWARRSLFYLQQRPLLVCEIFLPAIEQIQFPA